MKVEGVTCLRYHRGIDGLGTCDDGCQWWVEGVPCPYWFEESTYQRIKDTWSKTAYMGEKYSINERLFLEQMMSNPHTYNEWMNPDTIMNKFLIRRVRRLEGEIRYMKRLRNKKNRTILKLLEENNDLKVELFVRRWNNE